MTNKGRLFILVLLSRPARNLAFTPQPQGNLLPQALTPPEEVNECATTLLRVFETGSPVLSESTSTPANL